MSIILDRCYNFTYHPHSEDYATYRDMVIDTLKNNDMFYSVFIIEEKKSHLHGVFQISEKYSQLKWDTIRKDYFNKFMKVKEAKHYCGRGQKAWNYPQPKNDKELIGWIAYCFKGEREEQEQLNEIYISEEWEDFMSNHKKEIEHAMDKRENENLKHHKLLSPVKFAEKAYLYNLARKDTTTYDSKEDWDNIWSDTKFQLHSEGFLTQDVGKTYTLYLQMYYMYHMKINP